MTRFDFRRFPAALLTAAMVVAPATGFAQGASTAPVTPAPLASPPPALTPNAPAPVAPVPPTAPQATAPVTPPRLGTAPATAGAAGRGRGASGGEARRAETSVEQRIKELHDKLRITPAQQPQFDSFAQVMRDNAAKMNQRFVQLRNEQAPTAVDAMRRYADLSEAYAQDVQRMLPPFEALYNSMSPEQQKQADATFRDFQRERARGPRG